MIGRALAACCAIVVGCGSKDASLSGGGGSSSTASPASTSSISATSGAGTGGAEPTCDPSTAKTACDTCVVHQCCAEAGRCNPGTLCDAFIVCAKKAGCFDATGDFLTCATNACPAQATKNAVGAYQALTACIRADCQKPCGL